MTDTFITKLIAARVDVGVIRRDRRNPRFQSSYASLDAILTAVVPALMAHGLALTQSINAGDSRDVVVTRITDGASSVEASTPICADRSDPQKFGSAVTYARRYGLAGLLALAIDDDDDANGASSPPATSRTVPSPEQLEQTAQHIDALSRAALAPAPAAADTGDVIVHFGKNAGTRVRELRDTQVRWYADDWQPNGTDDDLALKAAAIAENNRRRGLA